MPLVVCEEIWDFFNNQNSDTLISLLNCFKCVELQRKNIYKAYAKIFNCSNINTDSPLSSNGVELEK